MKDRERQMQLARNRLEGMRAKRESDGEESMQRDSFSQKEILERLRQDEMENQQMDAAMATTGAG